MSEDWINKLFFGDNLKILKEEIADESVDLVYLDPPFNSSATYNVLFREHGGEQSAAQIMAFEDTWKWTSETALLYADAVKKSPKKLADLLQALQEFLGVNDMMAYLTMMAPRLLELHRVLKPTGSIYLHCDPTASHFLKLMMDGIFGPENFLNEIIWRRTGAHNSGRRYGPIHDTILFYSKTKDYYFRAVKQPYMLGHVNQRYRAEKGGLLRFTSGGNILSGAGVTKGESGQPWRGFDPTVKKRHWAIPSYLLDQLPEEYWDKGVLTKLDALYEAGLVEIREGKQWPEPVRYLRPEDGTPTQDIWAYQPYTEGKVFKSADGIDHDVAWLGPTDPERYGFQTQKPVGLLTRIIASSCPERGLVLDPFCGCGSTVLAAEVLKRKWIGIDITHLAVALIQSRIRNDLEGMIKPYKVFGIPKDVKSAEALAIQNRHQFEWWAVGLVGGRPAQDKRKGADRGVDGYVFFFDDGSGKAKKIVIQVKSGSVSSDMIRDLRGTMEREKAVIAAFITLKPPTRDMRKEAASSGIYQPEFYPQFRYNRIQVLTIEELLAGKILEYPRVAPDPTFGRKCPPRRKGGSKTMLLV